MWVWVTPWVKMCIGLIFCHIHSPRWHSWHNLTYIIEYDGSSWENWPRGTVAESRNTHELSLWAKGSCNQPARQSRHQRSIHCDRVNQSCLTKDIKINENNLLVLPVHVIRGGWNLSVVRHPSYGIEPEILEYYGIEPEIIMIMCEMSINHIRNSITIDFSFLYATSRAIAFLICVYVYA